MSWSAADIPDRPGRVAVVTGANGGLGLETAKALARKHFHVVIGARNQVKAAAAADEIRAETPAAELEIVELDLGSQQSVRDAAKTIVDAHPRIDLLVNNAGIMATPEGKTADGIELQFGTNHVGHFLLTTRLFPALAAADSARVVTVTSTARHLGRPLDPHASIDEGTYHPWRMYGRAKLANLHFAIELHRRSAAAGSSVASLAAHPGLSNTDLQATTVEANEGGLWPRFWHGMAKYTGMQPENGALPQLRAATDPAAKSGELYAPRFVNSGAPVRRPLVGRSVAPTHGQTLWSVSEDLVGERFEVGAG